MGKTGVSKRDIEVRAMLDSHQSEILQLCLDGETLAKMGEKFGVSLATIRNYCIARDLPYTKKRGWRHGSHTGEKHHSWKNGRRMSGSYIRVLVPDHPYAAMDGSVAEHRFVMERILGRYLLPGEVVHHKDGNCHNNAQENLELYPSNADHIRKEHSGLVRSEETRKKISDAKRGIKMPPRTEDYRRKLSEALTGRKFSESHKQKIALSAKSRPPKTAEQKQAASLRAKEFHRQNPDAAKRWHQALHEGGRRWRLQQKALKETASRDSSKTDDPEQQ
jgi:hypothetical protein